MRSLPLPRWAIERAGLALYGSNWRSQLARDLGVHERTLRRWVAGEGLLPPDLRVQLVKLIETRIEQLRAVFDSPEGR